MKRLFTAFLSIFVSIIAFAQPGDVNKLIHVADSLKSIAPDSFDYVLALDAVASFFYSNELFDQALPYRKECLEAVSRQREESDDAVLLIKSFLADTYSRLDRHKEAIELYLDCADIYANDTNPREDYFYVLNGLVVEYCYLNDLPSAIKYRSQAARLVQRLTGNDIQYAQQKWLLGELYASNNQHEAAISCFDESKGIFDKKGETESDMYSQLRKDLLVSLSRYSSELVEDHRLIEARPLKERIIELSDSIDGIDNYLRAIYRYDLGDIDFRNENYTEALKSYQSAESQLTDEDKEVQKNTYIIILSQQALCLSMLNRFEDEIPIQSKVVELIKDQNGLFSKEYALQMDILGEAYLFSGQFEKALAAFIDSRNTFVRTRQPKSSYFEFIQSNLIAAYYEMRQYPQAIKEREALLTYLGETYGNTSQQYLSCVYNLADIYEKNGEPSKAEQLQLKCWEIIQNGDLLYTPESGDLLDILAMVYIRKGDYAKALEFREKRLSVISALYGTNTVDYAEAEALLANTYFVLKDYSAAMQHYNTSIQLFKDISETDNAAYVQAVESLSYVKLAQNDTEGSISESLKALDSAKKKYGNNSINYAQVLSNLGDAYYTGQMYQEALKSYEESYSIVLSNHKTKEHLYEHLLESLPHAFFSIGDYENGIRHFELYRDYVASNGDEKSKLYESILHDLAAKSLYLKDYDLALKLNQDYVVYLENKGVENEDYARALSSMTFLYAAKNDAIHTKEFAETSDSLFKKLGLAPHTDMVSNSAYMYAVTDDDMWVIKALGIVDELNLNENEKSIQLRSLYNYLARTDQNHDNPDKAYNSYIKLLALDESIYGRSSKEYVEDSYNLALVCEETDPDESLSRLQIAKTIIEESDINDESTYSAILFWMGLNCQNRFAYLDASSYYDNALKISKSTGNYTLTQVILTNYGQVSTQLGNFAKAVSLLEEKLEYAKSNPGHYVDICQSLNELGRIHSAFSNYSKAIVYFEQGRKLAEDNQDGELVLAATLGIAECYESQQKYDEAVSEIERFKEYGEYGEYGSLKALIPVINIIIANGYLAKGESQKAKSLVDNIDNRIATLITNDPTVDGALYNTLALYYFKANEVGKSRAYFSKAQTLLKDAFGETYNEYIRSLFLMGVLDLNTNSVNQALSELDKAKELHVSNYTVNNPFSYTYTFYPLFARYITSVDLTKERVSEFMDLEKSQAEELFFQMTGSERSSFWNTHSYSKDLVFSIGTEKNYPDLLYNYALFYKGILLDADTMLGKTILDSGNHDAIDKYSTLLYLKEAALRNHIGGTDDLIRTYLNSNNGTESTQEELFSVINGLERELAQFARTSLGKNLSYGISYVDIASALGKNDVAIEFVDYEKIAKLNEDDSHEVYYCALILKPGTKTPELVELCTQSELNTCIKGGERMYDHNNYLSGELYKLVWEPLEKHIKKGSTVFFSPTGSLYQIALESIPTPKGKSLSEVYSLNRVSSTKKLCQSEEVASITSAILYGGLQYDVDGDLMISQSREYKDRALSQPLAKATFRGDSRAGWGYLPGTKAEVEALVDLFKQNNVQCDSFTGVYGNEESFKSLSGTAAPIIHIATHGFYLQPHDMKRVSFFDRMINNANEVTDYDPMKRSGLILSGGNMAWQGKIISPEIEDGVLTAEEIANLHLENTDLVVLSACESGLGDLSSDGVMGIQRAFKNAGVQTLIMSLWKVDDDATRLLMADFYRHLLAGESKRHSFEKAKETVKKDPKYSNPHYWAAFIMLD